MLLSETLSSRKQIPERVVASEGIKPDSWAVSKLRDWEVSRNKRNCEVWRCQVSATTAIFVRTPMHDCDASTVPV